jgi:hypothetical protein
MHPTEHPRVHVLTRTGCHLCEDALAVVERVCAATGTTLQVTDIDTAGDPSLLDLYSDQVPVTFVDGAVHDFWRVDEARLRGALRRPPAKPQV